jgi:hypothetical protein
VDRRRGLAVFRAASALLVFVAIAVQMATMLGAGSFDPTRFFHFFTILSNVFGATLFLVLAVRWRNAHTPWLDFLRGGSVVYLTITFLVVIWLLSGADLQVAIPWVDFVVHKIFPVVVVIDWLIEPPTSRIPFQRALLWLAYPMVWVVFTLIRGALDGWYPYPFLNPANGGYGTVAFYFVTILVGFVVVSAIAAAAGNAMGRRAGRYQPAT